MVREYSKFDPNLRVKNPYPQAWLWSGAGKSGISYSWIFSENQFIIELFIIGDPEKSDRIFNQLFDYRDEIEAKIGELTWRNPEGNKTRKIRLNKGIPTDIIALDETEKDQLLKWGTEMMLKFKETFQPFIQKLN